MERVAAFVVEIDPHSRLAGDLRPITQQVAVAMGTGNIAAVMIDQHLRKQDVASPR